MRVGATLCLLAALALVAACGRHKEATVDCGPAPRYTTARSVPPVQIPDDLSPPNENDALRLPPDAVVPPSTADRACLETPPEFSRDARLRRAESRDAPAAQAAPAAPAEPPANPDRAIDN